MSKITRTSGSRVKLPPRKIDLRDTDFSVGEKHSMRHLINNTNILPRTVNEIFGTNVAKEDVRDVNFQWFGQGNFRVAYIFEMKVRTLGTVQTILKVSHTDWDSHVFHQILAKVLDPREDIAAITAGVWKLSSGRIVMTEELIDGITFHSFIGTNPSKAREEKIVTLLINKCFSFWDKFDHIFIDDPHRHQFILTNSSDQNDIKIIDTGSVRTAQDITFEVPNDGEVVIRNEKGEDDPNLSWIARSTPRELLQNFIFNIEKPDIPEGGDYYDLDAKYEKGYDMPRIFLFNGIMRALGRKDGRGFLMEVRGIDQDLDKISKARGIF